MTNGARAMADEIETVHYQARSAADHRPCGVNPCAVEFPALPSRWCSGCVIDALLDKLDRLRRIEAAAKSLETALTDCLPAIESAAMFQQVHGFNYAGPTFGKELEALHAVLAEQG